MRLLFENWREYLREAALTSDDLPAGVVITMNEKRPGYTEFRFAGEDDLLEFPNGMKGLIHIRKSEWSEEPCGDAYEIVVSQASQGWGPLLYDIAMEYATLNGGGLTSGRSMVSPEARSVWKYYLDNRSDVKSHQMDDLDNTLTPQSDDNCDQDQAKSQEKAGNVSSWTDYPSSKRYTKPPTTIDTLKKNEKLVDITKSQSRSP